MASKYAKRYAAKIAELRKTDLRIDWSEIKIPNVPRRIALQLSERLFMSPLRQRRASRRAQTCAARVSGV
jgi:hypothetical protein